MVVATARAVHAVGAVGAVRFRRLRDRVVGDRLERSDVAKCRGIEDVEFDVDVSNRDRWRLRWYSHCGCSELKQTM
jgi:hypothetical protein